MTDMFRPQDLDEALRIAAEGRATLVAGCTDLYPATEARDLSGLLLDITAIRSLNGIEETEEGWRIGATTTWTDICRAKLPTAFDGLKAAAREVGSVQIQNAGTIGGNLCNASPAADGVPCLLTVDARVELSSVEGVRCLPLKEFLVGVRKTAIAPNEILTAVLIPHTSATGEGSFMKLGARRYLVISIAMAAARVETRGGRIRRASLAVGSCSAVAKRLPKVEAQLKGIPLTDAANHIATEQVAAALSPISDIRADAAYRSEVAAELIRRTIAT